MKNLNSIIAIRPLLRLRGYDYAQAGYYFVTLRTLDGRPLFGSIRKGIMCLNEMGAMAHNFWKEIPKHFPFSMLDEFNVLPNHIHGVLVFKEYEGNIQSPVKSGLLPLGIAARSRGDTEGVEASEESPTHASEASAFGPLKKNALGTVVHAFKSSFKRWCNRNGYEDFEWLPRFYDHIIRSDDSLQRIRNYIHYNTLKHSPD